ncbi:MAG: DUF92 domain-containing protein [Gemmatimonadaceae bacterium]
MISGAARRAGSLTGSGQWAAFLIGTAASAAGWPWALLLITYFVASSALTRLGHAKKAERTASTLSDARGRDAVQVFANGGLFAVAGLAASFAADFSGEQTATRLAWQVAGLGALAAAAADTWATEIGTLWGAAPRMVTTGRPVPPGVSGGVTWAGSGASVVAAALIALASVWILPDAPRAGGVVRAVFLGGVAGSLLDSLLGATLQSKRWCERCRMWTERRVHTCQYRTHHARGLRWMTNDSVNFLATVGGALVALLLFDALS